MGAKKRSSRADTADTYGFRGVGATSQAGFGDTINNEDLLFAVKREPGSYRTVFQVAHDIFAKWFRVIEVSKTPNPDFDRQVQKVLDALKAKEAYTLGAIFERLFGWSVVAISFVDYGKGIEAPVQQPREIRNLTSYSELSVDVQKNDEEKDPESPRFGLPVQYTLRREGIPQKKLHYTRAIHLATRLLDHPYKGLSVLSPMYDDSTVFRNVRWGMGQTMHRVGGGFADISIKDATPKQLEKLEASQQLKNLTNQNYFLHSDKSTLEFKGAMGKALNPEPYVNSCTEQLSMASGIPAAILRGAQAGALAGSDVNEREYFKFISDVQASFEPAIWQLIDLLMETGQIPAVEDYKIEWLGGFELNELDRSSTTLNIANSEKVYSSWLTVNELRARMKPPMEELEGPEGDVIPGLQQTQTPFSQPAAEKPGLLDALRKRIHGHGGKKNENNSDS